MSVTRRSARAPAGPPRRLTYAEYREIQDERRYELIEGVLTMVLAPSWRHQEIVRRLVVVLSTHVDGRHLGNVGMAPLDVILSDTEVLQPDVVFVTAARAGIVAPEGVRGAPDLVIEVLSPATAQRDRKQKAVLYAKHGVREMWIVDPDAERVEVFRPTRRVFRLVALHEGADRVRSAVLPDLVVVPRQIFAE